MVSESTSKIACFNLTTFLLAVIGVILAATLHTNPTNGNVKLLADHLKVVEQMSHNLAEAEAARELMAKQIASLISTNADIAAAASAALTAEVTNLTVEVTKNANLISTNADIAAAASAALTVEDTNLTAEVTKNANLISTNADIAAAADAALTVEVTKSEQQMTAKLGDVIQANAAAAAAARAALTVKVTKNAVDIAAVDLSSYAKTADSKTYTRQQLSAKLGDYAKMTELSSYAKTADLPAAADLSSYAKTADFCLEPSANGC